MSVAKTEVDTGELTRKDIWNRCSEAITRGFENDHPTLIDAPPASGKSHSVIQWADEADQPLTVLAPRHDVLDESEKRCDERGLSVRRLPSFHRDCGSLSVNADGSPEDERTRNLLGEYQQGLSGVQLHKEWDGALPCEADGECPFVAAHQFEAGDYDVLLGHYLHAYHDAWIEDRYVTVDEFPGDAYLRNFSEEFRRAVTRLLDDVELDIDHYRDLANNRERYESDVEEWYRERWSPYDATHVARNPSDDTHAFAPAMVLALVREQNRDNGWGYADLGDGNRAVSDESEDWWFLFPPNFDCAESVLGLDGTPLPELWELILGPEMEHVTLLNPTERRAFLETVLGLELIQTSTKAKPYLSGRSVTPEKDLALIEGIRQFEGEPPTVISSKAALDKYRDRTDEFDSMTAAKEHYGNYKGSNQFASHSLGIILGCPNPGHGEIMKWSALAGEVATEPDEHGMAKDFGPFGNRVLEWCRDKEVLQAVMRFGREEENGEKGAIVFIHTAAIPEWVQPEQNIPEIKAWSGENNGMQQVIAAIQERDDWRTGEWTTLDIAPNVDISARQVRDHLKSLVEYGYLESRRGGRGNAIHFSNRCLETAGQFGHVEFES